MKVIVQRVSAAQVVVGGEIVAQINTGLLVLLGITHTDGMADVAWMARKLAQLRIFEDHQGLMNRSVLDIGGEVLLVSQFTLYGDAHRGNRPSFTAAATPAQAQPLYQALIRQLQNHLGPERVQGGVFGAQMQVQLINEGPVTLELNTP